MQVKIRQEGGGTDSNTGVPTGITYAFNQEIETNDVWIDGKKIYLKLIVTNYSSSSLNFTQGKWVQYNFPSMPNYETAVKGILYGTNINKDIFDINLNILFYIKPYGIYYYSPTNFAYKQLCFHLYYTKP